MDDYNKIIESLAIRFKKAKNIRILQPVTVENFYDIDNSLLLVNHGEIKIGVNQEVAKDNNIIFIPGGKLMPITYGSQKPDILTNDEFVSNEDKYLRSFGNDRFLDQGENYSYVSFEAKVFDSVNFFPSLDIPPFVIPKNEKIASLISSISFEQNSQDPGNERIINTQTDQLVVELVRHILSNQLFVEQLATNTTYFKDPRLIDIFNYIRENLGTDLSNKTLANVANVSEDYVGQYFKMLTGINPQDYIEYQRMEMAVNLLRTSKKSIREIGKEVGYKDTAYFCRRFKMMFGIPAGKMRRRESLITV